MTSIPCIYKHDKYLLQVMKHENICIVHEKHVQHLHACLNRGSHDYDQTLH